MEGLKNVLNEIVRDYGLKILEDPQKFKAVFADYAKGEYIAEKEFFTKIIEDDAAKEIKNTEDIPTAKKYLVRKLHDRYFLDEKVLYDYLDIFIQLLRSDYTIDSQEKEEISNVKKIPTAKPAMKHVISVVNSWSFDVPIFFEVMMDNGYFLDHKNITQCLDIMNLRFGYQLRKIKKGDKLSLFSKKIYSFPDFIKHFFTHNRTTEYNILNNEKIEINGLQAEYYQIKIQKYNLYKHEAYLEKDGFFYQFFIIVPIEKRFEYQERLDAFIYSIKLD
jgi:hypothetical protein